MYTSPAYGTHQVLSEPGLDHLYESIDDCVIQSPQHEGSQECQHNVKDTAEVIAYKIVEVASSDITSQCSAYTTTVSCGQVDSHKEHVSTEDEESLTGYVNDMCRDGREYFELVDGIKASTDHEGD